MTGKYFEELEVGAVFEHIGLNQRDEVVCEYLRKGMMIRQSTL